MDNILNITQTKSNDVEFNVVVEGIKTEDMKVVMNISTKEFFVGIPCDSAEGDKWVAKIPPLPFLERTMYNFTITVIADGYYFEPLKGSVNVVSSPEIYAAVSKDKVKPAEKVETKPKDEKSEKKPLFKDVITDKSKSEEKPKKPAFTDLFGKEKKVEESNLDPQPDLNIKDETVKNILKGLKEKDKTKKSAIRLILARRGLSNNHDIVKLAQLRELN